MGENIARWMGRIGPLLMVAFLALFIAGCGSRSATTTATTVSPPTTGAKGQVIVTTITISHPSTTEPPSTTQPSSTTTTKPVTTTTHKPQQVVIDEDASGTTIRLHQRDTLVVELAGNGSTGYRWQVKDFVEPWEVLRQDGEPDYDASGQIGGGGTYTFTFDVVGRGVNVLRMDYRQPGDEGLVARSFEATVTADYMEVDETMAGSTISIPLGYDLGVVLSANPSTGHSWRVSDFNIDILELAGDPWFRPRSSATGAPGTDVFRFNTCVPGLTPVNFSYQPETGGAASKTFRISVRVEP